MRETPESESLPKALSRSFQIHGVLIRVLDTGVLLIGESGIGKSECALDLIRKGHCLVTDDVVEIAIESDRIIGKAPALTFELLEIRGLGIINVRELFGERAICTQSRIDLCIEMQRWDDVERVGKVIYDHIIADRLVPKFILPVSLGRNLSTLVETAVRLFLHDKTGSNASDALIAKHTALLNSIQ